MYMRLKGEAFQSETSRLIHKEVSKYAAESPIEFIAEVFAGRRAGKNAQMI